MSAVSGAIVGNAGSGSGFRRIFNPVGKVAQAFGVSTAFIAGIMGPVGGGKTTECIAKGLRIGMMQKPVWDPTRRFAQQSGCFVKKCRGVVVRDTYPNLDRTVIKSWQQWFKGPDGAVIGKWSSEAPRRHSFTLDIGRPGTRGFYQLDMEVIFTAIGENTVEDVLRGLECTWLWPNEWDLLPKEVLEYGVGRVGRYPSVVECGVPCVFSQIFGDFNAPEEDNHVYDLFVDQNIDPEVAEAIKAEIGDQPLIEFFRQPGARDPGAENLHNLPKGYYAKQLLALKNAPDKISRLIDNKFGAVRSGHPVYPEFTDPVHTSTEALTPEPALELILAADAGLTPALLVGQEMPDGQIRVYAELATIVAEGDELNGIGPTRFGEQVARLLASSRFSMFRPDQIRAVADPSSEAGTDGSGNELSWMKIVSRHAGVRFRKARTNDLNLRLEAVRRPLGRLIDGRAGLLIDGKNCPVLRRGFNSGYVYRRVTIQGGDGRYENKPAKNQFSHVHDAMQYLALEAGQGMAVLRGDTARRRERGSFRVETDYDIFGDAA